jgi:hypothetical protein
MARTSQEVLAYCTSCKMDLAHIVMAMQGDRIVKAQCKTCQKEHKYYPPKGITEPVKKAPKKAKKKDDAGASSATSIEAEWEKLMNAHKTAPVKSYAMKNCFVLGDKIKHPTFGEGIVGKLIYPNKIEIIFQHDVKILIHGGISAT